MEGDGKVETGTSDLKKIAIAASSRAAAAEASAVAVAVANQALSIGHPSPVFGIGFLPQIRRIGLSLYP